MKKVKGFFGRFRFLSNMHPCDIMFKDKFDGIIKVFGSSEHIYQAYKTINQNDFRRVHLTKSPFASKKKANSLYIEHDKNFHYYKIELMREVVLAKFSQNPELKERLLATGDAYLEETNTWDDTFWGVCNGVGFNHLGLILMDIRKQLKDENQ